MALQNSPGVVTRIEDFSDYAARVSTSIFAVVGDCNKGPYEPTFVTSERQLVDTFGTPMIETGSTPNAIFGLRSVVAVGAVAAGIHFLRRGTGLWVVRTEPSAVAATATSVVVSANGTPSFTIAAKSTGTWSAALQFRIAAPSNGDVDNHFDLAIVSNGVVVESYPNMTVSSDPDLEEYYLETIVNARSTLVEVTISSNDVFSLADTDDVTLTSAGLVQVGTNTVPLSQSWTSGTNGTYDSSGGDIVAGIEKLKKSSIEFNIVAAPGANYQYAATDGGADESMAIPRALVELTNDRNDCFALIDPDPRANTIALAKDFINGDLGDQDLNSINDWKAAYYWPWATTYDSYNKKTVWTPPSGLIAGVYANNDNVGQVWTAAAGFTRGTLGTVISTQYDASELGEREILAAPGQCVNPIINFSPEGMTVWGEKTTQRKPTALDRVSAARMVLYAMKVTSTAARFLIFEPNNARTWSRLRNLVNPIFSQIREKYGLVDFRVICDASTNPPSKIDEHVLTAYILLKPQKNVEVIEIPFRILSTGASFNDFAS